MAITFALLALMVSVAAVNALKIEKEEINSQVQVGNAHGLFNLNVPHTKGRSKVIRKRAVGDFKRKRRGYYEWQASALQAPQTPSFTVWQPASVYQVKRPYYIPVWGAPGRLPVYFPPQPVLLDGYPDSPRQGYLPPKGYLPPDPRTTTIGYDDDDVTMPVDDRNSFDDDRPIWGMEPLDAQRPTPSRTTPAPFVPTRRTRRPGQSRTTHPPLVHRAENDTQAANSLRPQSGGNQRPSAIRPAQERPFIQQERPAASVPSLQFEAPSTNVANTPAKQPRQPSRCVWAIISCCSATSGDISYGCFEQLGCQGPFWDTNPCTGEFAQAAIAAASNYYNLK